MKSSHFRLGIALLAAGVIGVACGGAASPTSSASGSAAATATATTGPHVGGTFTMAVSEDPKTLDAPKMTLADEDSVSSYIGAALVAVAPDGTIVPWMASSWQWSSDGKTVTFKLKPGIKWQDGAPFKASDFISTFQRDMAKATASPYDRSFLAPIASMDAPDATTLVLHLKAPDGGFLQTLADAGYLQPVEPAALAKWGAQYGQHPVSVGPYMLKQWLPGQSITLVRNPAYTWAPKFNHQGPAYFDKLVFDVIPQPTSQMAAFDAGTLSELDVPPEQWGKYQKNPKVQFFTAVGGRIYYLEPNEKIALFQDVRVRQALNDAMNRSAIVQAAFNGHAEANWAPFSPMLIGYWKGSENYYPFDPSKAKQLLGQAGYTIQNGQLSKDGKPVGTLSLYTRSYEPFGTLAQVIQSELQQIGIQTKITAFETTADLQQLSKGSFDLSVSSYAWNGDPGTALPLVLERGGSLDFSGYDNSSFDQLMKQYQTTTDPQKRTQLLQQAQQQYLKDAPWAMLVAELNGIAVQGDYKGVVLNKATDSIDIGDAYYAGK